MPFVRSIAAVLALSVPISGTVLRGQSETCPSSTFSLGDSEVPLVPNECVTLMKDTPDDAAFKLCGPGRWKIAPLSCDRHNYKAVTVERAANQYTASDCDTYLVSNYPNIQHTVGSISFECDTTAR